MVRQLRAKSSTGIYHVMLRGINRQIIFEYPVDYQKFIDLLCSLVSPTDEAGRPLPPLCHIEDLFRIGSIEKDTYRRATRVS